MEATVCVCVRILSATIPHGRGLAGSEALHYRAKAPNYLQGADERRGPKNGGVKKRPALAPPSRDWGGAKRSTVQQEILRGPLIPW